jgi:RNase P subunit RPR2|tara:strand:+ start:51 stop:299 length:249 start_codon:yes stop_codon:yes gene_type:complete
MGKEIDINQQQQVNINPKDLQDVFCTECENQTFNQVFLFKKLSAVLSPNGKESMIPLQVFKCDKCGNINDEFIPNNDGKKII